MILYFVKKLYNASSGSAAVEMALIFPVFLLMLVGVLDYGSAFVRKMQLTEIAKVGVHYAMVKQPTYDEYELADYDEIIARVNANLGTSGNITTALTVSYICKCNGVDYVCTVDDACSETDITTTFIKV
ncbi:MAG: pilus assembly protein, partial [Kordiimonadaceae bacterium]|nr:pilus assembly protein [Kordiimonadaceae bacterium]